MLTDSEQYTQSHAVQVCCGIFGLKVTKVYETVKGEAIQLQTWTGPDGSRSFRLPDFKTVGT